MVCAPYVDRRVKVSYGKFVAVIGNVRRKICRISVCTDKNIILKLELVYIFLRKSLLFKALCLNLDVLVPECAVLFIGQALFFHKLDCIGKFAVIVKNALVEPGIVFNSVLCEVVFHRLNIFRQSKINESLSTLGFVGIYILVAVNIGKLLCTNLDILAVVAVLGKLNRILALVDLLISYVERKRKLVDLIACIVDVELTADLIACAVKNCGKAVAESSASCVTHMHRARRIGGNKFNVYLLALAVIRTSVILALCTDILENIGIVAVAEIEIDKSRTCDLNSVKIGTVKICLGNNCVGDLPRSVSQLPCPSHSRIG